jgi:hypothetical protein
MSATAITADPPEGCLWLKGAAAKLGVKPTTLYKWRHLRIGPPSFRHAGRIVYRVTAIDEYLAGCEAADSRSNPALNPVLHAPEARLAAPGRAA